MVVLSIWDQGSQGSFLKNTLKMTNPPEFGTKASNQKNKPRLLSSTLKVEGSNLGLFFRCSGADLQPFCHF